MRGSGLIVNRSGFFENNVSSEAIGRAVGIPRRLSERHAVVSAGCVDLVWKHLHYLTGIYCDAGSK